MLEYSSPRGRWTLLATVLGSSVVLLDGTVVNVALPWIGRDLGAGIDGLQWTISGYLLTLSSLILLGGALGDRFGRRRVFVVGVVWFAVASLACGIAPNLATLVAARIVQGIGGALLTPGSLAIIEASFVPGDRGRAIGAWSGLGGISTAVGPLVGGYLTQAVSWRWIFLLNLPLAAVVAWVALRHVPETADPDAARQLDFAGATLAIVGLGGATFALIEAPNDGLRSPLIVGAGVIGVLAIIAFLVVESRSQHPMLPLSLFRSRAFSGTNALTFAMYGALSAALFLLGLELQQVVGYSPVAAGLSTLPVTILLFALSPYSGQLARRTGPRLPLTIGPITAGAGLAMMARIGAGSSYFADILPGVLVFGLGLSFTVAPLTATVMGAVQEQHAGVASAVNNAVARGAGLIAVAVLPVAAGLTGNAYLDPDVFQRGYRVAILLSAALAAAAGVVGWLTLGGTVEVRQAEPSGSYASE